MAGDDLDDMMTDRLAEQIASQIDVICGQFRTEIVERAVARGSAAVLRDRARPGDVPATLMRAAVAIVEDQGLS